MAKSATRARKAKRAPKPAKKTTRPQAARPRKKQRPKITAAIADASGPAADGAGGFFAIILDGQPKKPDLRLTKEGPDLPTVRAFTEHDGSLRLVPADQFRASRIEAKNLLFTPDGTTDRGAIFELIPTEG